MKWSKSKLVDIKRRADACNRTSLAEVCRRAGISNTTWTLWKYKGAIPREETWEKVEKAIVAIEVEHAQRAARAA